MTTELSLEERHRLDILTTKVSQKLTTENWESRKHIFRIFHTTPELIRLSTDIYMTCRLFVYSEMGEGPASWALEPIDRGTEDYTHSRDFIFLFRETIPGEIYDLAGNKVFEGILDFDNEEFVLKYCANHFFRVKRPIKKSEK